MHRRLFLTSLLGASAAVTGLAGCGAFVEHVVPILRGRGLLRTEYGPHRSLRDRYGLSRPANQYLTPAPALT